MTVTLLKIGLILIPFYEILVSIFPYTKVMVGDTRIAKEFISVGIALFIGLISLHSRGIKKTHNWGLLLLVGFLVISTRYAIRLPLVMNGVSLPYVGILQNLYYVLAFFLMFMAIQSEPLTKKQINSIFTTTAMVGLAMSVYAIIQFFWVDQFYWPKIHSMYFNQVPSLNVVGNLGQPTVVSPFIAMIVPLMFYIKRPFCAWVMITAVCLTQSCVAVGAMIISLVVFVLFIRPRSAYLLFAGLLIAGLMCVSMKIDVIKILKTHDSGRFKQWEMAVDDWKSGVTPQKNERYPLTGAGLGIFTYIFHDVHKSSFFQLHNDWLELLYNIGLFGLILFILAIVIMFYSSLRAWRGHADYKKTALAALMASFICVAVSAGGVFVWQLGVFWFYTTAIVGLLHNNSILIKEEKECTTKNYLSRYLQFAY